MIGFPFHVDPETRQIATVAAGSEEAAGQAIEILVLTRPGEHPLTPGFGTPDPVLAPDVDLVAEVRAGLHLWGPEGVDARLASVATDGPSTTLTIEYTVEPQ